MRLRDLKGWTGPVVLLLAACGGNVVVDGLASGTGGTGGTSSTLGTGGATTSTTSINSTVTSSTSGTTFTTSSTGTGTSSGECMTSCGAGLMTGIMPCDGLAFTTYTAL